MRFALPSGQTVTMGKIRIFRVFQLDYIRAHICQNFSGERTGHGNGTDHHSNILKQSLLRNFGSFHTMSSFFVMKFWLQTCCILMLLLYHLRRFCQLFNA